ncbi:MAG: restriction endonuclease subunit S [candidate division WOR-3 bacterium]
MQYSIVNYKTVKENSDFRIDAEYYKLAYFKIEENLEKLKIVLLKDIFYDIKNGVDYRVFVDRGNTKYIRTADIKEEGYTGSAVNIQIEGIPSKVRLKKDDILFTRKGNFGCNCVVNEAMINYLISSEIMLLRRKDIRYSAYYLSTYLRCFYAQEQINRNIHGVSNYSITQESLENLKIPVFSNSFQLQIEKIVKQAYQLLDHSKSLYSQAEELLLSELGLLDWQPKHTLTFVKNFSDTQKAERMDAEYFQPKYEEIIEAVKRYKGGFGELGDLVRIKKSVEPGSEAYQEEGVPFVRVSNLSKFELSTNNQQFISEKLYEELKIHQPKKGEILLSKDATPGIAYYLNEEPQKMIVSGGILRLKISNQQILPEYLTLVLNSVIVQKQIERDAGGSIINHWRPDQVKKTLIPILKEDKQKEIKELIEKSFSNRSLSKSLLEIAKRGVEIAIEQDEQEAEKWINGEIKKLGVEI